MDDKKDVMGNPEEQDMSKRLTQSLTILSGNSGIPDLDSGTLMRIQDGARRVRTVRTMTLVGAVLVVLAIVVGFGLLRNSTDEPTEQGSTTLGFRDSETVELPPKGMRWEGYAQVIVAVPQSWGYAEAPRDGLCPLVTSPYVDTGRQDIQPSPTVPCTDATQMTHVTVNDADSPPSWHLASEEWLETSRIVSGVRISVTYSPGESALAEGILDSAHAQ